MKISKIIGLALMASLATGCGSGIPDSRVTAQPGKVTTDTLTENALTRLVTVPTSWLFGDRIDIINVNKGLNSAGYLQADVRAHNRGRKTLRFQYKFEWLDINDFPLNTKDSVWQLTSATGGTDFSISGTSPRKEAVSFRLQLRENY